jgi:hypothetical protein
MISGLSELLARAKDSKFFPSCQDQHKTKNKNKNLENKIVNCSRKHSKYEIIDDG